VCEPALLPLRRCDEDLWCQASGSGRAEPTTRTDSEARTRKSRFQVQVDSLSHCRLNGVFELKRESREMRYA
jgi:hypothetical protein